MGFSLKQSMKLSQQLRMTPQLQQAIKMLQLSKLELESAIRKELNENPLLEEMIDTVEGDPCLLYTSPSPRDQRGSRMPSSA